MRGTGLIAADSTSRHTGLMPYRLATEVTRLRRLHRRLIRWRLLRRWGLHRSSAEAGVGILLRRPLRRIRRLGLLLRLMQRRRCTHVAPCRRRRRLRRHRQTIVSEIVGRWIGQPRVRRTPGGLGPCFRLLVRITKTVRRGRRLHSTVRLMLRRLPGQRRERRGWCRRPSLLLRLMAVADIGIAAQTRRHRIRLGHTWLSMLLLRRRLEPWRERWRRCSPLRRDRRPALLSEVLTRLLPRLLIWLLSVLLSMLGGLTTLRHRTSLAGKRHSLLWHWRRNATLRHWPKSLAE